MQLSRSVGASAVILAGSSIGSYVLGLLRDRLLAGRFGAGADLDVFNSAFLLPDLIMNLFAAALTTVFIPIFVSYRHHSGVHTAWEITTILLNILAVIMVCTIIIAWIFMPQLSAIVAPGFDIERRTALITATRLLLVSPILFGCSIVVGSALQGMQRWLSYALSPILYNLGIVLGILMLAPRFGIYGVIVGVIFGAAVHLLVRLIALWCSGWRWSGKWQWRHPAIKHIAQLMVPRVLGLLTVQANLWVYNAFASGLMVGSIAVFNLARNFQSLPVSLFGIAIATAVFPTLSYHFAERNLHQLHRSIEQAVRQVLFLTIPASIGMILLASDIVHLFLGSGKFTEAAILATTATLAVFALSIPFESVLHILARAFYAKHDMITPVKIALISSLANLLVCWLAIKVVLVAGLAIGFVITAVVQVTLLTYQLRRLVTGPVFSQLPLYLAKILLACGLMTGGVVAVQAVSDSAWLTVTVGSAVGAGLFIVGAAWWRLSELTACVTLVKKFVRV